MILWPEAYAEAELVKQVAGEVRFFLFKPSPGGLMQLEGAERSRASEITELINSECSEKTNKAID